jgi:hypothetical protein
MSDYKPWYESKTVVINAIIVLLAVLGYVLEGITAGALPFSLDPEVVAFSMGIINVILRFTTSQPVK